MRSKDSGVLKTPHEKHQLGIGEFSYGPCTYLGPFHFIKTKSGLRGNHDLSYGLQASISFKIGYTFDLGVDADARKVAFKKARKLLRDALKKLDEAKRMPQIQKQ